jgi:chromosomal replication initiator protein
MSACGVFVEVVWNQVLNKLKEKTSAHIFDTWFKQLRLLEKKENTFIIAVPNSFTSDWLNNNYKNILFDSFFEVTGEKNDFLFKTDSFNKTSPKEPSSSADVESKQDDTPAQYSFENFVVGSGNQFAHAACLAVADNPGRTYNPLFLYGGVGLGKTHLMKAIVDRCLKKNPRLTICYDTAESFTNEMINSIRYEKMPLFRKKYRNIDVLLLDDIQFIAGKERTQEEFFHTFNSLFEIKKQIILSSDKKPQDIDDLEERLISRFQWGLIADIQPPDTETKVAILKKKALARKFQLSNEVAFLLANSVKSNIRELESLLNRLEACASFYKCTISLEFTQEVLKDFIKIENKEPAPEEIQKLVSKYFNIKLSDLKGKKKNNTVVLPRQIAMYIIRKTTSLSFPDIGDLFGGRDHSTVIHSIKKIECVYKVDQHVKNAVDTILKKL